MPTPEEAVGHEVRRLRIAHGWSQDEVAQRMSAYGYDWHQTLVGRIEAAQRPLRLNEAAAMAALFEVSLDSLMFASYHRLPEDADAEIKAIGRGLQNAEAELDRLHSRRQALEKDLHDVTEQERKTSGAMFMMRTRLEGLEERYGRRPRQSFEERYGWRPEEQDGL